MRVKLIIGQMTQKTKPWWNPFSKAPKVFMETNLEMGELVNVCRTTETNEHGILLMYWAKNPTCPKGDEFLLMRVDPYYNEEWLKGDAKALILRSEK